MNKFNPCNEPACFICTNKAKLGRPTNRYKLRLAEICIRHKHRLINSRPAISAWGFGRGAWLGDDRTTDSWGIS